MLHLFDKKNIGFVLDSFVWLEMGIVCNLIERSTEIKYHFYLIKVSSMCSFSAVQTFYFRFYSVDSFLEAKFII